MLQGLTDGRGANPPTALCFPCSALPLASRFEHLFHDQEAAEMMPTLKSTKDFRFVALIALALMAACGGGETSPNPVPIPQSPPASQLSSPVFNPAVGNYSSQQLITITHPNQNTTIYYTIDGSLPTTSSAKYTGGFAVSSTHTLKAIATATGQSDSDVASATYTITLPAHTPTSYYVSPSGDDTNTGTLDLPFATIQHAVDQMAPGDTANLRAGNYNEAVTVRISGTASAPITLQAYLGETPTLVGAKPVAGPWTVHSGMIHKASWPEQPVQVFADGQLLNEARWPNQPVLNRITDQVFAITDAATTTSITKTVLPPVDLTGAWIAIWSGQDWVTHCRPIATHDQVTGTLSFTQPIDFMTMLIPRRGNNFFIFGKLELLDSPGEWWWDPAAKMLYIWMPDGGAPEGRVEAGTASAVLDLQSQTQVIVQGLSARGGWFNLANCTSCTIQDCQLWAPTWIRTFDGWKIWPVPYLGGVDVSGIGNTVQGGSVRMAGRAGIHLAGYGNTVRQMTVEDCGVNGTNNNAVDLTDACQALVENCTIRRSNSMGLNLGPRSKALKNIVEDSMLFTDDAGNIGAWGMDGQGAEIAYNIIRGNQSRWGAGIYLDAGSYNYNIHDNLIEHMLWRGINFSATNIVEHNTFNDIQHEVINVYPPAGTDMSTARVAHNIISEPFSLYVELAQPASIIPDSAFFCAYTPLVAQPDPRRVEIDWSQLAQPGWSLTEVPMNLSQVYSIRFELTFQATTFDYTITNLRLLPEGQTGDTGAVPITGTTWTVNACAGTNYVLSPTGRLSGSNPQRGLNALSLPLPTGMNDLRAYRGLAFELSGSASTTYDLLGCLDEDNGPEAIPGRGATLPALVGAP
jgi:hypothetical protein